MPAMQPVPQVLRIQFVHNLASVTSAFVHHYLRYSGPAPSANDCNNIAGACSTAWNANFASLANTGYQLSNVNVWDLTAPTAGAGTNAVPHQGTRPGTGLTANDCMLVNQHIARRYRGGKPRQYWPFGVTSDLGGDFLWSSTFLTAANTALTGFLNALLAISWAGANVSQIVNVSFFSGYLPPTIASNNRAKNHPAPRATPLIDPVTNHTINSRVATQRRRQHFSA